MSLNGENGVIKFNKPETQAYIGGSDNKFLIIDITNYSTPTKIGETNLQGVKIMDLYVSQKNTNQIFVASHYFTILNIADPNTITKKELNIDCQHLIIN